MFEQVLAVILIQAETELSVETYAYMGVIVHFCQVCCMSGRFHSKMLGQSEVSARSVRVALVVLLPPVSPATLEAFPVSTLAIVEGL